MCKGGGGEGGGKGGQTYEAHDPKVPYPCLVPEEIVGSSGTGLSPLVHGSSTGGSPLEGSSRCLVPEPSKAKGDPPDILETRPESCG